jgi:hypothetical protein
VSAPALLTRADPPRGRSVELVLAHAHLRLGALALARVELETMAGLGLLDTAGLVDLAEVRWRTGDLLGAGEAATAALRDEEGLPVALVVAAEAAAALGRPTEARRLAARVIEGVPASIDVIFAGMPRSGVWPDDAAEPPPTAPTLFDREPEPAGRADGLRSGGHAPADAAGGRAASTAAVEVGFWDGEAGVASVSVPLPDPAMELEAGREALVAGAFDEAALRLGLALRLAPALAPAVLEVTDGARSPSLSIVRGDAYRLAGHETEARQAYAVAAQGGPPERRLQPRTPASTGEDTDDEASTGVAGAAPSANDDPGDAGVETSDAAAAAETIDADGTPVAATITEADDATGSGDGAGPPDDATGSGEGTGPPDDATGPPDDGAWPPDDAPGPPDGGADVERPAEALAEEPAGVDVDGNETPAMLPEDTEASESPEAFVSGATDPAPEA